MFNELNMIDMHIRQLVEESNEFGLKFNDDMIEWQAACYMENLILEQMMYEDFNEDKLDYIIENKIKDRLIKGAVNIKDFVDKILEWLDDLIVKLNDKFNVFKSLMSKYGRKNIEQSMKFCNVKVKMPDIQTAGKSDKVIENIIDILFSEIMDGKDKLTKDNLMRRLNVKSIEELTDKIKKSYFIGEEKIEMKISDLDAKTIIGWLEGKSITYRILELKKLQRELKTLKLDSHHSNSDRKDDHVNYISDLNFMLNLIRKVITTSTYYELKVTTICKSIVLRAMATKNDYKQKPTKNDEDEYWDQ